MADFPCGRTGQNALSRAAVDYKKEIGLVTTLDRCLAENTASVNIVNVDYALRIFAQVKFFYSVIA